MKTKLSAAGGTGIIGRFIGLSDALFGAAEKAAPAAAKKGRVIESNPIGFDTVKVVRAALPESFRAFEPAVIEECRGLFDQLREDLERVTANTEDVVRKRYKVDPGLAEDMPLHIRIEQAAAVRRAAKARRNANYTRISELLEPGMLKAAAAVEKAAQDYAAAEQATAERMGISWEPSCIARAIAESERRIRARSKTAGYAPNLSEATCGLVE